MYANATLPGAPTVRVARLVCWTPGAVTSIGLLHLLPWLVEVASFTLRSVSSHMKYTLSFLSTATLGSPPFTFSPGTFRISQVSPSSLLTATDGALLQPV